MADDESGEIVCAWSEDAVGFGDEITHELIYEGVTMTTREELARVLYEAPFEGEGFDGTWPPSHESDREWWLTRADAVLAAGWRRE